MTRAELLDKLTNELHEVIGEELAESSKEIESAVRLSNVLRKFAGVVPVFKGIKNACKYLNNAEREVSIRKTQFYDTVTNELIAEVNLKQEEV